MMPTALERFKARAGSAHAVEIGAHRGVVSTVAAHIEEDDEGDEASLQTSSMPKPGVLPANKAAAVATDAVGSGESREKKSAVQRLKEKAEMAQRESEQLSDFKKNMSALRTLSRLMEAVYIRPGNAKPAQQRMQALLTLVQASQDLSADLLDVVGERMHSDYSRAMAMDAVVGLVGRAWEDADSDAEFLRNSPIELLRQAAANEKVVAAALQMAQKTWDPVATLQQHEEALIMAAHRAYWQLYLLGEHVPGMTGDRCEWAVSRLLDYLQDYPQPRGSNPEMRASWFSASMGRLSSLACAEIKARYFVSDADLAQAKPIGVEELKACIEMAIEGFENVERYAQKLLGDAWASRVTERSVEQGLERSQALGAVGADVERDMAVR